MKKSISRTKPRKRFSAPSEFHSCRSNLTRFLLGKEFLKHLSVFTGNSLHLLESRFMRFHRYLLERIRSEGVMNVCKTLKNAEREFLLKKTFSFLKRRLIVFRGWTESVTLMLLSVHKVLVAPIDMSLSTIQSPRIDFSVFAEKYSKELELVRCHMIKISEPIRKEIFGDYEVRHHKEVIHKGWKFLGNLSNDPTVDSNDRTGGLEYPLRITLSSCSNGPALSSQIIDAKLLCLPENVHLLNSLEHIFRMLDYKVDIKSYAESMQTPLKPDHSLSRVIGIHDKSCKTRVIAIFDTYSQVALRPFHMYLDKIMVNYPRDFSRDHSKGVHYLKNLRGNFHSFDISSATDTLPHDFGFLALQWALEPLINEEFTEELCRHTISSVKTIMIGREFSIGHTKDTVTYSKGQPMGAYASFPMLGLTQHMLVQLSSVLVYGEVKPFLHYGVVGDDLVIKDDKVAETYLGLCNELQIPINRTKTVVGQNVFEFCKRIVVDGHIASFPSLKAHYVSFMTGQPYVLLKSYMEYGHPIPDYRTLCKIYRRGDLRDMLAFHEVVIPNGPSAIVKIPSLIKAHAERTLVVDLAVNAAKAEVKSQDPFLKRLNYGNQILSIFKSNIKKLGKSRNLWYIVSRCRANTFYLGYVKTFLNRRKLRLQNRSLFQPRKEKIRERTLRHLCMCNRNQWYLVSV